MTPEEIAERAAWVDDLRWAESQVDDAAETLARAQRHHREWTNRVEVLRGKLAE